MDCESNVRRYILSQELQWEEWPIVLERLRHDGRRWWVVVGVCSQLSVMYCLPAVKLRPERKRRPSNGSTETIDQHDQQVHTHSVQSCPFNRPLPILYYKDTCNCAGKPGSRCADQKGAILFFVFITIHLSCASFHIFIYFSFCFLLKTIRCRARMYRCYSYHLNRYVGVVRYCICIGDEEPMSNWNTVRSYFIFYFSFEKLGVCHDRVVSL